MKIPGRQHLIFDADDTLWENNVYFENAFQEFCDYLNHSSLTPDEIRAILDEIEIENNRIHGYGAVNFGRNLSQCYLRLAERAVEAAVEPDNIICRVPLFTAAAVVARHSDAIATLQFFGDCERLGQRGLCLGGEGC